MSIKDDREAMRAALDIADIDEKKTVVVREGVAPEVPQLKAIQFEGNLRAVQDYLSNTNREFDQSLIVIQVNENEKSILMMENPGWPQARSVKGSAMISPDHSWLGLLTVRTIPQTRDLLRGKRRFFANAEDFNNLADKLNKFQARVNSKVSNQNDGRGNTDLAVNVNLADHGLPQSFRLHTELLKGFGRLYYEVHIFLHVENNQVSMWFESDEANDLIDNSWKEYKTEFIALHRQNGFCVIES